MAIVVVQKKTFNTIGTPISVTFDSTPSVGNAIFVNVGGYTAFGVTDNQASGGNTYTNDVSRTFFGVISSLWHSAAITKASGTFTINITSGSDIIWGCIYEVSGLTSSALNVRTSSAIGSGSGTASTGSTPATTENNAFVLSGVGFANSEDSTVESVSPAWTVDFDLGSFRGEGDHRIVSTTGTQSCSWSLTSGANYAAVIAAYSDPVEYTPPRITQVVQSVVVNSPDADKRVTQVVQGLTYQGNLNLRLTQVVQTLVVTPPIAPGPVVILTPTNTNAWKLLRFDLKKRDEEEA